MKFKDDEWLTDYINALHFTVRLIENQNKDKEVGNALRDEAHALIQEALLCNIPMELFNIKRITKRLDVAESEKNSTVPGKADSDTEPMETYKGDILGLISDYHFICQGLAEFSLEDIIEESSEYLAKTYPDIEDIRATITELFNRDIKKRKIEETASGVFRHMSPDNQIF
ncbi:hypothetical protein [Desulfonema magnum]|uniref:Uncharacterized protein n=1 Tax=Desulfonema magnum TaxID=45655 RepID=A0A975BSZ7_9BACT|nr:hypothetical protein [Desulfonema magnum]QTA91085.1 Uncharacterized protein dnm_071500 [Desulfonema magnum]